MTPERRAELLSQTMLGRSVVLPAPRRHIYYNCVVMSEDEARALMTAQGVDPAIADMVVMAAEEWTYSPGPRGGKRWIHNTTGNIIRSEPAESKRDSDKTADTSTGIISKVKDWIFGKHPDAATVDREIRRLDKNKDYTSFSVKKVPLSDVVPSEGLSPWKHADHDLFVDKYEKAPHTLGPLAVLKVGDKYVIYDGHNRYKAAKQVNPKSVWVVVLHGNKWQSQYEKSFGNQ